MTNVQDVVNVLKPVRIKEQNQCFCIIRPDLCLNCNACDIARICPEDAIDRLYIGPEDDFKGIYELEYGENDMNEYGA
jgi:hypothetical protein